MNNSSDSDNEDHIKTKIDPQKKRGRPRKNLFLDKTIKSSEKKEITNDEKDIILHLPVFLPKEKNVKKDSEINTQKNETVLSISESESESDSESNSSISDSEDEESGNYKELYKIEKEDQIYQQPLIEYEYFENFDQQIEKLIEKINYACNLGFKLNRDLLIIALGENTSELVNYIGYKFQQYQKQNQYQLNFFIPGKPHINTILGESNADIFWKENAITITHTYRAKGNEAYWVFLVGLENIAQNESDIGLRNQLFTAMTRTKGWLWIGGIKAENGQEYSLYQELETAIKSNGEITFINRTDSSS